MVSLSGQCTFNRLAPRRLKIGTSAQEAKAAGEHLVAVRHGEVDRQTRLASKRTARAGRSDKSDRHRRIVKAQGPMAMIPEDCGMCDAAVGEGRKPAAQGSGVEQTGMMFERARNLTGTVLESQCVEVAHVDYQCILLRGNDRVIQGAQDGRWSCIHHDHRQASLPFRRPGHRY